MPKPALKTRMGPASSIPGTRPVLHGEFTCVFCPSWCFSYCTLSHSSPTAMESLDDRSSAPNAERSLSDVPEGGKLERIAAHTQGLVTDLREWIDLRIDLAILEVEERLDETKNEIALGITLAVFGFFAALFSLTTVALGVGWLLGHPFWGFLAVAVALILVVVGLRVAQPALVPPSNLFEALRSDRADAAKDRASGPRPASAAVEEEPAEKAASGGDGAASGPARS